MNEQYLQGDLMFEKYDEINSPNEYLRYKTDTDGDIVARGEKTGHKHRLVGGIFKLFLRSSPPMLFVEEDTVVTHEQHPPLSLEKGVYKITRQRVLDYDDEHQAKIMED